MRHRLPILTLAVSLALMAVPRAQDLVYTRFGEYLESLRVQAGIPGLAAGIVGSNDLTWERPFGQQNVERSLQTRTDTPFHVDGLTQIVTAALVLRCVEEGHVLLDDRIGQYAPRDSNANATIRQVLSHTSGTADSLSFSYQLDRLRSLSGVVDDGCWGETYRETAVNLLERFGMVNSVPGSDVTTLSPPPNDISPSQLRRFADVLSGLAIPYSVDAQLRASPSRYPTPALTPATGLVSTVRDLARFDVALKKGALLRAESIALAWTPPAGRNGQRLPHGLGWFVQSYNGEQVVWQFGLGDNASSSLIVMLPGRGLTLILLANSSGLSKGFNLAAGDVTASPFARTFLGTFVR